MIKINNKYRFSSEFMQEFLRYAFGSMSKKELELLIFKLILQDRNELNLYNKYELSKLLKIPESRVKTLFYEMQLRENSTFTDEWFVEELKRLLNILKLENSTGKIILQLENPLFKSMFENLMRKGGTIIDYSFNKDIIKIDENAFILIIGKILSEKEKQKIVDKIIKKDSNKNIEFNSLLKSTVREFIKSASGKAGEKFTEYGLNIATNGVSHLIGFVMKWAV